MIKKITVTNHLGDSIILDLQRPELSGFAVQSITGLGPGKSNIKTTEAATIDGGFYNSARIPCRNIALSLIFLWKDTIEESRQRSYKYFPLKKKITLEIETENRDALIDGYVESNEPNIFSKSEGTDISIVCPNPYFYSKDNALTIFSGITAEFQFPFSNESTTESLISMGTINKLSRNTVLYNGDADVGVTITIHAIGDASGITIHNTTTREMMKINTDKIASMTGSGLINGDDIIICTIIGKKTITLIRDATEYNILACLDKGTSWFQLVRGDNVFAYTAETGNTNLQFKIENQILYEGV